MDGAPSCRGWAGFLKACGAGSGDIPGPKIETRGTLVWWLGWHRKYMRCGHWWYPTHRAVRLRDGWGTLLRDRVEA
jgi:hypothetical protein